MYKAEDNLFHIFQGKVDKVYNKVEESFDFFTREWEEGVLEEVVVEGRPKRMERPKKSEEEEDGDDEDEYTTADEGEEDQTKLLAKDYIGKH